MELELKSSATFLAAYVERDQQVVDDLFHLKRSSKKSWHIPTHTILRLDCLQENTKFDFRDIARGGPDHSRFSVGAHLMIKSLYPDLDQGVPKNGSSNTHDVLPDLNIGKNE